MRVILPTTKISPYVNASIRKASEVVYDIADRHGQYFLNLFNYKQNHDTFVSSKKKAEEQDKQSYL